MSLKAFHIIFVTISMLLAGAFGVWAIVKYRSNGDVGLLAAGVISGLLFVALGGYGRWFLRKLQNESYL